uniref:WG repeat-containing protein n=1 Tax=candidate division WOR-3 bacterium TaxID=2052148 RepID=A0A7C4THQ8_UNCW3
MPLLFVLLVIEPVKVIKLPVNCTLLATYGNETFFTPFVGKGILKMDSSGIFETLLHTENENYRIYDFAVTPFAFYLNDSKRIEKCYKKLGVKEIVYEGNNISSFIVTPQDELVVADIGNQELVFLNGDLIIKRKNILIIDLDYSMEKIFALTPGEIMVFDKYGNILEKIKIPERFEHITVYNQNIYLSSRTVDYIYKWDFHWVKIELGKKISALIVNEKNLLIIDEYGSNLFVYNNPEH